MITLLAALSAGTKTNLDFKSSSNLQRFCLLNLGECGQAKEFVS